MAKRYTLTLLLASLTAVSACSWQRTPEQSAYFERSQFASWKNEDAAYRFFPGDKFTVNFRNAPELDREFVVAPDGRISLPLIGPVMVANRSSSDLRHILQNAYARELVDPALNIVATEFASQQIFVGGEVRAPGLYPLPGQIDSLQAITLAGGWTDTSKPSQVIILRRGANGQVMTRVVDVKNGIMDPRKYDIGPLHRFDIIYVSRSRIADENQFVQQFLLNSVPIDFSFYYNLKDSRY